jgi:ATP-dependent exoDNAse (exonuclease V) alpha subunit
MMSPSDTELPFILKRRQFQVQSAFAMTINKSQGQTLNWVGLYLPVPVFPMGNCMLSFQE